MQQDAYIYTYIYMYMQVLYAFKYLYIWLHIAIYTHICTILVPREACETPIHSTFTAKKAGVHATLGTVQHYPTSL